MVDWLHTFDHKEHSSLYLTVIVTSQETVTIVSQPIRNQYRSTSTGNTSKSHPFWGCIDLLYEGQPLIKIIILIWLEKLCCRTTIRRNRITQILNSYPMIHCFAQSPSVLSFTLNGFKKFTLSRKQSTCHAGLLILMVQGVSVLFRARRRLHGKKKKNLGSHCTAAIKPKHLTYAFMVLNNPEVLIKMKADIGMKDPPH